MADVSDNGAFNAALLSKNSDNYGPASMTQQANTNAQTQLTQQQVLAAQIQNANARWQYTQLQNAAAAVNSVAAQNGPNVDHSNGTDPLGFPQPKSGGGSVAESGSDQSGTDTQPLRRSAQAAEQPAQAAQHDQSPESSVSSDDQRPQPRGSAAPDDQADGAPPSDDNGQSASNQAKLDSALDSKYNVSPAGTDDEQHAIAQASMAAAKAKILSKSGPAGEGLSASADANLEALKGTVARNVQSRQNDAKLGASQTYDKLAAVESAPKGKALDMLDDVGLSALALNLKKAHPGASPEELDHIARETAAHMAANVHRFTDRETTPGDDGVTYDKQTGLRVSGVPIRGVDPKQQAELVKQANDLVTKQDGNGKTLTQERYKWDGYQNSGLWVTHAIAQIKSNNTLNNQVSAAGIHAARYGHITPGQPPAPGGTLYQPPQGQPPGAPAPGSAAPGVPAPGAPAPGAPAPGVPAPGAPAPGAPAPGQQTGQPPQQAAPPGKFGDDKYVINSLQDKDYRLNTPPARIGVGQSPGDVEEQKNVVAAKNDLMKTSNENISSASQAQMYLTAAQRIMAGKGAPATGLPGQVLNDISRIYGGVDSTNYQEVAKYLGNAALQGAKTTYGARMTQKEVELQLNELSPSTKMTPEAINNLLGQMKQNAQYAIAAGSHAKKYLAAGNDPRNYEDYLQHYYPRDEFVNGQTPPTRTGGQQSSGATADSGGFIPGKRYTDKSGNSATYAGNGKWQ